MDVFLAYDPICVKSGAGDISP